MVIQMNIFAIAGIALTGVVLALVLNENKKEYSVYIIAACGLLILLSVIPVFNEAIGFIKSLISSSGITNENISIVLKAVGIGYVTEFAADVCRDAGTASLASKVELAGKLIIVVMSFPLIGQLLEILQKAA